jgi:hypothetical protein
MEKNHRFGHSNFEYWKLSFDRAQDGESFDFAQDPEPVERLAEPFVIWCLKFGIYGQAHLFESILNAKRSEWL